MIKAMFMGMRASGGDDCGAVRMMIKAMFMRMRASGGMIVGLF